MARLKMASYTYNEHLSESQLSPVLQGQQSPQVLSKLEILKNEYQERVLREKEQKMLKMLTQKQERVSHRINGYKALQPTEEKVWASNWTVTKRTAGVDRAHPLKPVYPLHESKAHRFPSASTAGIKNSLPYVRSKSGPSRTEQWKELERNEMNLEAEIRRKEALLREKLRRTEEELRRIQKEKEETEWEEKRDREVQNVKMRPRRTRLVEEDSVKAGKDRLLSIDQYCVKSTKDSTHSIDQYRRGSVKALKDSPLSIDHYNVGSVKVGKHSPLSTDQFSRDRVKNGKDSPFSIDKYSKGIAKREKDNPIFIDEAHQQYVGARGIAHLDLQGSSLTHVVDSFHELRLEAPEVQDNGRPSSEYLDDENTIKSLGEHLVPCHLCGRSFMENRLQKHTMVCQKMHSSKRKVFDSSKARAKGTDLEQYLHKKGIQPSTVPQVKTNSWRQKHESFLRTIRQARVVQDVVARGGRISDLPPPPPEENPDYISCPHCSRRFAPRAAERHIPKCETIKSKPRPPPSRRR
ncbi:zinc finger C2HC domain-containing protein 1C isoform 2-T2 [Leptodactylus fuscus]|uniref:zinc finger C2HC domain-containing protein 1C isoform X2 n=1 Tax=Leptodactylus fuscus TaxID=238119 RepID=UPI003F4E4F01